MKPDTARFLASFIVVAMAPVFLALVATGSSFGVCLIPIGVAILSGFVASTQDP
jgi:hypothetical protein